MSGGSEYSLIVVFIRLWDQLSSSVLRKVVFEEPEGAAGMEEVLDQFEDKIKRRNQGRFLTRRGSS